MLREEGKRKGGNSKGKREKETEGKEGLRTKRGRTEKKQKSLIRGLISHLIRPTEYLRADQQTRHPGDSQITQNHIPSVCGGKNDQGP